MLRPPISAPAFPARRPCSEAPFAKGVGRRCQESLWFSTRSAPTRPGSSLERRPYNMGCVAYEEFTSSGIMTRSMTWIRPLEASMSAPITVAPSTLMSPPLTSIAIGPP